jgi:hypothetical protein
MAKINKNNSELLEQAKRGKLSPNEIDYVAQQLVENTDNRYTLIHILGRAEAIKYRNLIEPFLHYPDDPLVSEIALKSLCTYWGLSEQYVDELKMFIKGVEWDDFDDVRMAAISISGEYLRSASNAELLHTLIDVFENLETSTLLKSAENPELIRSCAYSAIARAMGREYDQIPNTTKISQQMQQNTLDLLLIEQAKHLK